MFPHSNGNTIKKTMHFTEDIVAYYHVCCSSGRGEVQNDSNGKHLKLIILNILGDCKTLFQKRFTVWQ